MEAGTLSAVYVHFNTYTQGSVRHKSMVILEMLDCMYEVIAVVGHIIEQLVPTHKPFFDTLYMLCTLHYITLL